MRIPAGVRGIVQLVRDQLARHAEADQPEEPGSQREHEQDAGVCGKPGPGDPAVTGHDITANAPGRSVLLPAPSAGFVTLLTAFRLFDKSLPQVDAGVFERRWGTSLERPAVMFLLGLLVTSLTLSVSISLTILVPLAARGLVKSRQAIPYIMGANISTFVDTLLASLLIRHPLAFTVVLTEMLSVAAVSLTVLAFFFRPYQAGLLRFDRFVRSSRIRFAGFVLLLALVPLMLFVI